MPVELNLYFDTRQGPDGVPHSRLLSTIVDLCEYADQLTGVSPSVCLPEHHGFTDGYLPSPIVLGSAIAGRTQRMRLDLILLAPFYNPIRLAEDLAVLDLVSRGRLEFTLIGGYVGAEFEAFGVDPKQRGKKVEEAVAVLKAAWTGEEFEHNGRRVRVTPRPYQQPRPPIVLGGSSGPAARRAARTADGFWPTVNPVLQEIYQEELRTAGRESVPPPRRMDPYPTIVAVSNEPDRVWEAMGPSCMHETNSYYQNLVEEWGEDVAAALGDSPVYPHVKHWDELRESGRYLVLTPEDCTRWIQDHDNAVTMFPLMGGVDPAVAWQTLKLFAAEVLPALADGDSGAQPTMSTGDRPHRARTT